MKMVWQHVERGSSKHEEHVDLDEKIRRIKEKNKERERRFKEIQKDKEMAEKVDLSNDVSERTMPLECKKQMHSQGLNENIKPGKGRGKMLLEISNRPSKAERFRTKQPNTVVTPSERLKLTNKCRSVIREKVKSKRRQTETKVEAATEKHQHGKFDENILCNNNSNEKVSEMVKEALVKIDEKITKEGTSSSLKNDKEQSFSVKQNECHKNPDRPSVSIKKTVSSSSLEESMAMLSPLDLPQNWGDIEFSDEEPPKVTIWKD